MLNRLLPTDDPWIWMALDISLKATLLLAIAAAVVLLSVRTSAALRHRVWALSFIAILLLPLASLALPGLTWQIVPRNWHITADTSRTVAASEGNVRPSESEAKEAAPTELSRSNERSTSENDALPSLTEHPQSGDVGRSQSAPRALQVAAVTSSGEPAKKSSAQWLWRFWLTGTLLVVLPLIGGIVGNLRLKSRSEHVADPRWRELIEALSRDLCLHREVTLLLAGAGQMPMTFGFMRPCIVLPADALEWSVERRRVVLLHELAHIKRYDVPWQMVARVACAMYWFHPLVWWALRRMRMDREHACDDCVLTAGQKASNYATHLLEIARVHRACSPLTTAALSMARRSQLEGRLLAVLDAHRERSSLGYPRAIALLLSTLVAVVALGMIRPVQRVDSTALASDGVSSTPAGDATAAANTMVVKGKILSEKGTPVAGAQVEVIAMSDNSGWPVYRNQKQTIEYGSATTATDGRFEVAMPKAGPGKYPALWALVSADGMGPYQWWRRTPQGTQQDVQIKLAAAKTVRVQLVDAVGNPVAGVEPQLWQAWSPEGSLQDFNSFWLPDPEARALVKLWPKWTASDSQGYTSAVLFANIKNVSLLVEDERFGCQISQFEVADEPVAVALRPGLQIGGTITAADTGKPIEGAELLLLERPFRRVRTQPDGTFSLASALGKGVDSHMGDEVRLQIYPPADSPYLFLQIERKRPTDGSERMEIPIKLWRGTVVEGQIIERGTGRPVVGASVWSRQQEYGNLLYHRGSEANYSGTDMNYATDAEGRFRMPVWPGPGYLLVKAPTIDYLHVPVSLGDKYYGKSGLGRGYHDGALKINFKPGEKPQPVAIELERGITLRRKVVRPDGQPASGILYCRSYLADATDISGNSSALPIENGLLELPGFGPEQSNPLFLIDLEHHCGLALSPTDSEVDLGSPPIQLLPCGVAKFHIVDEKGEPRPDYEPWLHLVVTPGAPATNHIEPDQPLWSDTIIWQNVVRPAKVPRSDADGRVVFADLIPGATYHLGFVSKKGSWDEGYEFTVQSGETTDVGDVVIPDHG
jgi:beta-lactamase regulating signal transducer with metallopeptidase domain